MLGLGWSAQGASGCWVYSHRLYCFEQQWHLERLSFTFIACSRPKPAMRLMHFPGG